MSRHLGVGELEVCLARHEVNTDLARQRQFRARTPSRRNALPMNARSCTASERISHFGSRAHCEA